MIRGVTFSLKWTVNFTEKSVTAIRALSPPFALTSRFLWVTAIATEDWNPSEIFVRGFWEQGRCYARS